MGKKIIGQLGNRAIRQLGNRIISRLLTIQPVNILTNRPFNRILPLLTIYLITFLTAGAQAPVDTFTPPAHEIPKTAAEMLYYDAMKAKMRGDDKEAEGLFLKVTEKDKTAAGAWYELARLAMKQNKTEQAITYAQKAIDLDSTNPWYMAQHAEILISANKFEEAAAVYSKLAAREKYNEEYLFKATGLYMQSKKYKEALAMLDKIIEKEGEDEEWLIRKQELYLNMNDVEGAVKILQKLADKNPQDGKYYARIAEIYETNKMPEKAAEVYKKTEKLFAEDPLVQLSLSQYYRKKGDTAKYHALAKKAITNKGLDAPQQMAFLIDYIRSLGNDSTHQRDVLDIAGAIATQHPGDAEVIGVYGDILILNNERKKGIEQYKKSVEIDPSRYQVWQNLLYQYTEKENADSLLLYSSKALRMFPNQAQLHFLKGVAHSNKQQYPEAIKSINRGIDMQPEEEEGAQRLAEMHATIGEIYNTTKQYDLSDSSFKKALSLDPDNAFTLNNYSYFLSLRGKYLDEAERMSKKSLELRPNTTTFMDTYGWILYKQGKYDKAKEYIQKAIDASGANADGTLLEHMGDIMFRLKETDKAVELWKQAKQKGTENPDIDKKISDRKLYE